MKRAGRCARGGQVARRDEHAARPADELQKRVRGLEDLEQRLAALERKVDKLGGAAKSSTTTRKSTKATSTKSSGGSTAKKS